MLNKKALNVGLCSANFNPDLRKIRSGLNETVFFGHVQLCWVEAFGTSTPWLHFDMFHISLAKKEVVQPHANISEGSCIGWGKPTRDANQNTIYI
jgi:hypothetical protein